MILSHHFLDMLYASKASIEMAWIKMKLLIYFFTRFYAVLQFVKIESHFMEVEVNVDTGSVCHCGVYKLNCSY